MALFRRIGCLLLVAAAAAVYFLVPQQVTINPPADHSALISAAESDYSANNGAAQYVYGQIDAAGIAAKDNLDIIARQMDSQAVEQAALASAVIRDGSDKRVPAELLIGVALLGLIGVTQPRPVAATAVAGVGGSTNDQDPNLLPDAAG
jgi:hypothetical protein